MSKKKIAVLLLLAVVLIGATIADHWEFEYTDPRYVMGTNMYEPTPEEDSDHDGLLNAEELEYGTNIYNLDTDGDYLTDFQEIKELQTNPLAADSDQDGLDDRAEVLAGLNPNNNKTDQKTPDRQRTFEVGKSDSRLNFTVSGNANIYNVYAGVFTAPGLANTPGLVSDVYEFYLETPFDGAELTFHYTDSELKRLGYHENNLSVFKLTNEGKFKAVASVVDPEKKTVTAKLRDFSKYTLGDGKVINAEMGIKVMLLIDNSGSMYSDEDYPNYYENDPDFKRLDMAKALLDYAGDSIQFGIAKFTKTYTLLAEVGRDNENIQKQIEEIRTKEEDFNGTYIANSLRQALEQFGEQDFAHKKYIVLLTDGKTTESLWDYDEDDAIRDCLNKRVSVIVIGLGSNLDVNYLQKIADQTGGVYLHASNSEALDGIYKTIYSQLNYAYVDIDADGDNDAITVADSGFTPERNGFSFDNYSIIYEGNWRNGQCFGLAAFAQCFYRNKVPVTRKSYEAKLGGLLHRTNSTPPAYDLTDTGVLERDNLHDYTNKWLNALTAAYAGTPIKKRYSYEEGTLKFTEEFRKTIKEIGCKYLVTEMSSCKKAKWGGQYFNAIERMAFDLDKYLAAKEKDPDMDFLVAIYWYYSRQAQNMTKLEVESRELRNGTDAGTMLVSLAKGIPLVFSERRAGHSVNITRILRDMANPRKYYLEIYDNNYPGESNFYSLELMDIGFIDQISVSNWHEKSLCNICDPNGESVTAVFSVLK